MSRVLVPLATGCEEMEAVTIIDILRRAGIEVIAAGLEDGPVTGSRGTRILPDMTLDEALRSEFDMVVLPGGLPGSTGRAGTSTAVQESNRPCSERSICSGEMARPSSSG